jgi:hypothetical protein
MTKVLANCGHSAVTAGTVGAESFEVSESRTVTRAGV